MGVQYHRLVGEHQHPECVGALTSEESAGGRCIDDNASLISIGLAHEYSSEQIFPPSNDDGSRFCRPNVGAARRA